MSPQIQSIREAAFARALFNCCVLAWIYLYVVFQDHNRPNLSRPDTSLSLCCLMFLLPSPRPLLITGFSTCLERWMRSERECGDHVVGVGPVCSGPHTIVMLNGFGLGLLLGGGLVMTGASHLIHPPHDVRQGCSKSPAPRHIDTPPHTHTHTHTGAGNLLLNHVALELQK